MNRQRFEYMRQAQRTTQEAADALQLAREKLMAVHDLYGSGKAGLALYRNKAEYYSTRCNDILTLVEEMIDTDLDFTPDDG